MLMDMSLSVPVMWSDPYSIREAGTAVEQWIAMYLPHLRLSILYTDYVAKDIRCRFPGCPFVGVWNLQV